MTKKRTRAGMLACVGLVSLGIALAVTGGPAAAKSRNVVRRLAVCRSLGVRIADNSSVQVPFTLRVPRRARPVGGKVIGVASVGLRITHTYDRDVTAFLASPAGLVVPLVLGRGDTGDNFGSGTTDCAGTLTSFTDTAATSIGEGTAPFAGAFRPEAPLSAFTGSRATGIWRVVVSDSAPGDAGTLHAASLSIKYRYKSL